MVTMTRTVAAAVVLASGKGTFVFNDKLEDGRRSLKVWGWTEAEYNEAKLMLERAGCEVVLRRCNSYSARGGKNYVQLRLHVTE